MRENMTFLTNYYQIREMTIDRMKEIINQNKNAKEGGAVFFGDSITQFMDIEKYFPEIENKYNCGIGGITSTMLLYFIDEGVLKFKPKQLVYMIGTNDLGKTVMQSPKDIAINVKELVETVHYNLPECEIYVVSPLPCLPMHDYKHTPGVLRSNDLLKMVYKEFKKTIPYEYVTFINAYPILCNKKGEPVGYGGIWTSPKDTKIGVVAIGYGDGYPRDVPEGTPVYLNGRIVPIVGRVSMDMLTVDLGADSQDKVGDEVILWGKELPIEMVAKYSGILSYELITKLTPRVITEYVD